MLQVKGALKGASAEAPEKALEAELSEIRAELADAFSVLRTAFVYYSMAGSELPESEGLYKMTTNDWTGFCQAMTLEGKAAVSGGSACCL